jgi:amino acid adenylation domain-containing protein
MKDAPQAIAVIGLSGRFPGADSIGQFWSNLVAGRSSITEVPPNRWDAAAWFDPDVEAPNKSNSKWGGFLRGVDLFDPLFFGISPREASLMDPQQRLFLEEAWSAVENAGYAAETLGDSDCGVFAGVGAGDYLELIEKQAGLSDGYLLTGNTVSTYAGRVAYLLNLKGPCLSIDTACSSSMVAIHLACESIRTGRAGMAIAGGASVMTTPRALVMVGKTGLLSPRGRCAAFDDSADGYVPGEASVALVLKALDRALRDGDTIHAVIRASGINHDGRTNGLTAPNAQAQGALQEQVLREAGVGADTISLVEAMATGTHLGDAIEVNGLTAAFRRQTDRRGFCPIGSLKTNIGHSGPPSGAASLVKVILAMANGKIPPSLNHSTDNALARLGESPFFVADTAIDWTRDGGTPRRALLNSFGHSGTNACLVVEEAPARAPSAASEPPFLLTVSGRNEEALRARLRALHQWWEGSDPSLSVADAAFTLNAGRSHFRHRVALVAEDHADVLRQLSLLAAGNAPGSALAGVVPANVPSNAQAAATIEALTGLLGSGGEDAAIRRKALTALAQAYVAGFAIDWRRAEGGRAARRIVLPGYAFARERHWIRPGPGAAAPAPSAATTRFFAPTWAPADRAAGAGAAPDGALLVFDVDGQLHGELRHFGRRVILVEPGPSFEQLELDRFTVRPSEAGDYASLLSRLRAEGADLWGGVYAWSHGAAPATGGGPAWTLAFDAPFLLVKALASSAEKPFALVFACAEPQAGSAFQAAIGGLARCLPHEAPRLSCKVLRFEPDAGAAQRAAAVFAELADFGPEEVCFRGGGRRTRRFVERELAGRPWGAAAAGLPRRGGTYVISGGAGALGQIFAGRLSREFEANVVLLGRSALDGERTAALERLSSAGAKVVYLQADVADHGEVERALAECRVQFGPINGVIHAAGVLRDGLIAGKELADAHAVLAPKAEGAMNLDAATCDDPLDFFALFSSIASVTGNIGQTDYAVANRFLDAFAETREGWRREGARRGRSISINWTYWKDGGMRPPQESLDLARQVFGMGDLGSESGWRAFLAGLGSDETQLVVVEGPAEGLLALMNPPVRRLADERAACDAARADPSLTSGIERLLVGSLSELLQLDASRIQTEGPITELGVDSMVFTQLVLRLNRRLGLKLTPALLFEHPTIRSFAQFLARNHAENLGALGIPPPAVPAAAPAPARADAPARFPLSAGQQALWFLAQLSPGSYAYNLPIVLPLEAPVDKAALQRALDALVARHGALRTVFRVESEQPWQIVLPRLEVPLRSVSLGAAARAEVESKLRESHRAPLDLDAGPLLRAGLFARKGDSTLLLLTVHHLVFDGASAPIFIEELLKLYAAARTGDTACLPAPGRSYDEFVAWQQRLLAGEEGGRLWDYWSRELGGEIPVLNLPTDRGRPPAQTYRGETLKFEVDEACAGALRELAAAENATLYMVLMGAFLVLLHRYSGQDDIIVGSPMAGRNEEGFGRTLGYFVNVVALRCGLSGDPTFRALLGTLRGKVYGALEHQDFPLSQLVQRLKVPRDPSRSPLFQVAFNLETWARRADASGGGSTAPSIAALEPFEWLHQEGEFDLALDIFELDRPLKSAFRFNPDLFDRTTIERMADHFRRLLAEIAADPGRTVSSIPLLGGAERELLLRQWNATDRAFPGGACLHEVVAAHAGQNPGRTAVICGDVRLTYAELNDRADRWARALARLGVGSGSRLGVCLDRSAAMLVAVLAVMKTGAAYVPLDPAFPPERLEFMASDAQLRLIITQEDKAGLAAFRGLPCLCVDAAGAHLAAAGGGEPPGAADAPAGDMAGAAGGPGIDATAYLLYTSGSTGRPKGVEITHRSLANFLWSMAQEPGLSSADVLLAVTTLSFDIAALELFLPLLVGAQVVIARHDAAVDGRRLLRLLKETGATVMQATPATWTMLLESGWDEPLALKVLCGGEALSRKLADRLLALGREVWNLFGPTETTVWSTVARVTAGTDSVPIGRPIANTQIYILDARMQPVPIGVPGELYIGGAGVARGYWRRAELTAEKFVVSPFGRSGSDRLYRTGDYARWRRGGVVDFLGRADSQVKIRGFRIEVGEVEHALQLHSAVAQAAVVALGDRPGDRQLVAYWIRRAQTVPSVGELRAHLQTVLPDYMIPSAFVLMERFPLTPNGKLDRKQLPAPERERPSDVRYVEPRSEIERTLGRIWAEALGLSKVGMRDNFFELGGHSLLATEVVRTTRRTYDIELLDLFTYPTVQALAGFIEGADRGRALEAPKEAREAPGGGAAEGRPTDRAIAIVGVAGRFPGAADVAAFWENLKNGVESITRFSHEELLAAGISPELLEKPNYVRAGGVLERADCFDAEFFGYSQTHARLMDPQQRVLLEAAWETLDDAGCNPDTLGRRIGVFAGIGSNSYHVPDILEIAETTSAAAASLAFTSVEKDFAATRISYKLDLKGPSLTVQTACSSSLVAVHLACQSLANGECEAALAGGVSVFFPQVAGYLHQKDMALSPDGHCRAFDARAQGTVFTNGVALVLLKPLSRAVADRDQIYAVIRGTAIGNDGSSKVDYMAPSVQGQSDVIARAMRAAGVSADTIGMVEAHGTGTAVGDPIEVRALSDVYHGAGAPTAGCALGSLKTNVGHLNIASGAAGLIKAALCLRDRLLVPSLNFETASPHIDLANSPFYVSTRLADWPAGQHARRAAVSSLGIGGTNAHAVLEEPPEAARQPDVRTWRLLPLSAKTPAALRAMTRRLAAHLACREDPSLGDAAFTLQAGRTELEWRHFVVCDSRSRAVAQLGDALAPEPASCEDSPALSVVFLFPGEASPGCATELYGSEPAFRRAIDSEAQRLAPLLGFDPRPVLFPSESQRDDAALRWADPAVSLPLTVLLEHAMCALWESWGIRPDAVVGRGWGEYSAGIAAGVFAAADLLPALSGPTGTGSAWLGLPLVQARLPLISSTTGGRVGDEQALLPAFWMSVDRAAPRWHEAVAAAQAGPRTVILDMAGATAARAGARIGAGTELLESLGGSGGPVGAHERLLRSLGRLWQIGRKVRWAAMAEGETPRKVSLPSYPFERKRHWLEGEAERPAPPASRLPAAVQWRDAGAQLSAAPSRRVAGDEDGAGHAGLEPLFFNGGSPHFRRRLLPDNYLLRDHVIAGKKILPGAVTLELARAAAAMAFAGESVAGIREVVWMRPIPEASPEQEVHVHLAAGENGVGYELRTGEGAATRVHTKGRIVFGRPPEVAETLPIEEIRRRCPRVCSGDEIYQSMREYGTDYGASLRCIEGVNFSPTELLARLQVPGESWEESAAYVMHPCLLDGCFQAIVVLAKERALAEGKIYLPFALGELVLHRPLPRVCWVHAVRQNSDAPAPSGETQTFRIRIADAQGVLAAELIGYSIKFFPYSQINSAVDAGRRNGVESAPSSNGSNGAGKAHGAAPLAKPAPGRQLILASLQQEVARLVGAPSASIDPDQDLGNYGLDSILVIDFISAINAQLGLSLSPAVYFEHRSLNELTGHILAQNPMIPAGAAPQKGRAPGPVAPADADAIAVVGMAGVFPKSPDLETLWGHLAAGRNLITEIPPERWDWREHFGDPNKDGNKTNVKWGGFIADVDKFDPKFFNLSPRDAECMDPQHRIMLETVWRTIEDAGYSPSRLSGTRTGLFVGVSSFDYQEVVMKNMGVLDVRTGVGVPADYLPNRISFLLNLQGPSEPVSTACSSSLVALHRAAESIRRGDCEQAIVGGVNLMLTPNGFIYFSKAGILSQDGHCRTFDHRANGYVRGEGAGAVLIKPLRDAVAAGDHIYGLIKGSAVNHSGRTRTFGAPSPLAEARVVRDALERAGVSPATVNYIEAHGTGTALGDPVEISGLRKAFEAAGSAFDQVPAPGSCGVGSVKTNLGHLEAAAGIVSLIKVLLALKHRQIPASLGFEKLNPHIQMAGSPFYVVERTAEWVALRDGDDRPLPRRAGISSFGFGGVNSHVVVEEYPAPQLQEGEAGAGPQLLVLSARAPAQLKAAARLLSEWIGRTARGEADPDAASLADAAFTLQVGRDAMAERLAVIAGTHAEAARALSLWLDGRPCAGVYHARVPQRRATAPADDAASQRAEACFSEGRLGDLAELWVSGEAFSWESVRRAHRRRRVSMPGYPFARERYWLEPQPGSAAWTAAAARDPLEDILSQVRSNALSAEDAAALLEVLAPGEAEPSADAPF